ncbi:MAG: alpha-glucan family phosphorylase [Actinomycetota bacterium]|nr:alpha-glucan family phosphorylase [Actinomycetota bacterium]
MNRDHLRARLVDLAANYRWTWDISARDLLASLPGADDTSHPVSTVRSLSDEQCLALADDHEFMRKLDAELERLDDVSRPDPTIAYCSPEFGLSHLLPQYSGGLGVLAGDHLKAACDLGLPLIGLGIFYRAGVYHQSVEGGEQTEYWEPVTPESVGARDTGVVISVPLPGRDVQARVWRIDVGRVGLFLLDTDLESNNDHDRLITDHLYFGSKEYRLQQEMVLGVGGARALEAMGLSIEVHHLNEGHAGFIAFELIDRLINGSLAEAVDEIGKGLIFTTHTPVPAGIDKFPREMVVPYLEPWARKWNISVDELWALGEDPDDNENFNMAAMCLRVSKAANGVSKLHGQVSRELFSNLEQGQGIGHVTNGVHARTWTGDEFQRIFDEHLGLGWNLGSTEAWARAGEIDESVIEEGRLRQKARLGELIAGVGGELDPEALVIGFARRFAPYKRANLLLRQYDRLVEMLADDSRPVHFVFAGKAHPANLAGKALVAEILAFADSEASNGRFSFIPDYDIRVGARLVQGSDIWLNNPIRPREASGTSGEKVVLNGGLNCSILDGWWAEMYDGENGWAIPTSDSPDDDQRDDEEAVAAIDTLTVVRDEFFESRRVFVDRIRHSWRTLGSEVTAARMVAEYEDRFYLPARRARTKT